MNVVAKLLYPEVSFAFVAFASQVCRDYFFLHLFLLTMLKDVDGTPRDALACQIIWDASERCRIGFLPRECVRMKDKFVGKFAQICELYDDSSNRHRRRRSHRNCGMASATFLDAIPEVE